MSENSDDYGKAKTEGRVRGMAESTLKKSTADDPVLTGDTVPTTSTETPDPNVTSIGDTTDTTTSGTVTGDANTTRSSSRGTSGTNTARSGNTSSTTGT